MLKTIITKASQWQAPLDKASPAAPIDLRGPLTITADGDADDLADVPLLPLAVDDLLAEGSFDEEHADETGIWVPEDFEWTFNHAFLGAAFDSDGRPHLALAYDNAEVAEFAYCVWASMVAGVNRVSVMDAPPLTIVRFDRDEEARAFTVETGGDDWAIEDAFEALLDGACELPDSTQVEITVPTNLLGWAADWIVGKLQSLDACQVTVNGRDLDEAERQWLALADRLGHDRAALARLITDLAAPATHA